MKVEGSCHCGKVKYQAEVPEKVEVHACNCSICQMVGFQHLIVPSRDFELLSDPADITTYTFNSGVAKHTFCRHCGVKPFYTPRSNPDGVSLNFRCLDEKLFAEVKIEPFDGQHWEENAASLSHLSK